MSKVGSIKVAALLWGGVCGGVQEVRGWAVVVRGPFVEMVCDVEGGRVR